MIHTPKTQEKTLFNHKDVSNAGNFRNININHLCNSVIVEKAINARALVLIPAYYYRSPLYCVSIAILYVHFLPIKQFR